MRPVLSEAQAAGFSRGEVLRYTGTAGAERAEPWSAAFDDQGPELIVGQGGFATVQAAVNHALRAGRGRVVIGILPGQHRGLVYVPRSPVAVTLLGLGQSPAEVELIDTIDAEMPGADYAGRFEAGFDGAPEAVLAIYRRIAARDRITTANASVLRVEGDDFQLRNLTLRNGYNADRDQPQSRVKNAAGQYVTGQHQAVALLVAGADRVVIRDVHLRSFQDTLYLQSPAKGQTVRACLTNCDIEGDVDFIFGQSTAWFERCRVRSLGTRAPMAWATAPSTDIRTRFGFVFDDCDFVHDGSGAARAGRFSLGRQWFEGVRATPFAGGDVPGYRVDLAVESGYDSPPVGTISAETLRSVGKCVIMRSRIGAHIDTARPWDDWSGRAWNLRHRPALYTAGDMMRRLHDWLRTQAVDFDDIDPEMVFLAEYDNR